MEASFVPSRFCDNFGKIEFIVFVAERPPQDVLLRGGLTQPFYKDLRVILPLSGALIAVLVAVIATALCWRTSKLETVSPSRDRLLN